MSFAFRFLFSCPAFFSLPLYRGYDTLSWWRFHRLFAFLEMSELPYENSAANHPSPAVNPPFPFFFTPFVFDRDLFHFIGLMSLG